MCVYLRAKFEVSRIIITSLRQGVVLHCPPPTTNSKRTPRKPTQIRFTINFIHDILIQVVYTIFFITKPFFFESLFC